MNIKQILFPGWVPSATAALLLATATSTLSDVVLVPGHIEGTVSVGSRTIQNMTLRATNFDESAQLNLAPNTASAPYDLVVNVPSGGSTSYNVQAYNVRTRDAVAPPWDYDYLAFPTVNTTVDETTPAVVNFELPNPNTVEGTVILNGTGELNYVYVYANPSPWTGFSHYTLQYADASTRNNLTFEFPVSNGNMQCNGTAYLVDGTRVNLPSQLVSPVSGIVSCNWTIDTPDSGEISGSIEFTGPGAPNQVYISASGPTSRSWSTSSPANPDNYFLGELSVGTYYLFPQVYLNNYDDYFQFPNASFDPNRSVSLAAGDSEIVDIMNCQAFIDGTVDLVGAGDWSDIDSSQYRIYGLYTSGLPDGGPSAGGSANDQLDLFDGSFDLVVSPGPWYSGYLYMRIFDSQPGDYLDSWLYVYDRSVMYTSNPATPASCGDTVLRDFEYNLGSVTVNFSIAGSDVFSDPELTGYCREYDEGGSSLYDYSITTRNLTMDNVSEGALTFIAPQADCIGVTARARVGGTLTTFGEIDLEVIGGGNVVIDIGGPGLTLVEPTAGQCVVGEDLTVTGTATDDVGVASVEVNGVAATLDPAGGEGTLSTDFSASVLLSLGANTVQTVATDTSDKTGSDSRTVYRDDSPPALSWSPVDGATTPLLSIDVEGVVSDDVGIDSVEVNGVTASLAATGNPNEFSFSVPLTLALGDNTITVAVTEETGCDEIVEVRQITVIENLPPTADAAGPYTVDEGFSIGLDGSASSDPDGDPLTFEWDFDYDGASFDVDASGSATPTFSAVGLDGPAIITVGLRVTDDEGEADIATTEVTIVNVAPSLGEILTAGDPVPVGTEVVLAADFTDAGTPDTHSASWNWGDGSSTGTVSQGAGSGSVEDGHSYTQPGVYTVELTVTDDDTGEDQTVYQYVVVYDPNGSFVTGGGFIDSPTGAYLPDPALSGKANFGFVSKYKKGTSVPEGNTEFQFHAASMDFKSSSYQWLVVAGAQAKFKGVGTIKNVPGSFGFMVSATDGHVNGGGDVDKFRIKIWNEADESIVYDNQMGAADDADPTAAIGGGSIVIHSKGKK